MLEQIKEFYYAHQEENIQAIKYAIAFVLAYSVTQLLPTEKSQWVIITVAVIMGGAQPVMGHQILRSLLRICGTLIGASLGVATIYLPFNHFFIILFMAILAIFFSKLASRYNEMSYISILGMVTFAMVALVPNPSLHTAFVRVLDIFIGIVIALLVSLIIFPLDSRRAFILQSMQNFKKISHFIQTVYIDEQERANNPEVIKLEGDIMNCFYKQRLIIKAEQYEPIKRKILKSDLMAIIRSLRAIYHHLLFINAALYSTRTLDSDIFDYINSKIKPAMQSLTEILNCFQVEKAVGNYDFILNVFKQQVESFNHFNIKINKDEQNRIEVIYFSLTRIIFFINMLCNHWNKIQKPNGFYIP